MRDFRDFLTESGIVSPDQLKTAFTPTSGEPTPYQLRYEGLDRQLSAREWARVLSQLCKRRGYKSMKLAQDSPDKDKDEGRVKAAIAENAAVWPSEDTARSERCCGLMSGSRSRAVTEETTRAWLHANKFSMRSACCSRPSVRTATLSHRLHSRIATSRYFSNSNRFLRVMRFRAKVGRCSIDRTNPRISAACPTFERFRLVDKLLNVRYTLPGSGRRIPLDKGQRDLIIEKALGRTAKLTYADIRKICGLPEAARFVGVRYGSNPTDVSAEAKEKIPLPRAWHEMRRALSGLPAEAWENLSNDINRLDDIAEILTYYKYDESVLRELRGLGLPEDVAFVPVRVALLWSRAPFAADTASDTPVHGGWPILF